MSIGVGSIGWGAIAEHLHGPCMTGMEECNVVAVCDEREKRLAEAADAHGCAGYREIDGFFDHSRLQMVVIARPNFLHGPSVPRVLSGGKHAVVEKERLPDSPTFHLQSRLYYRNVFAAIRSEESRIVTPEQSRRYVATAEAIVKSARERGSALVTSNEDK